MATNNAENFKFKVVSTGNSDVDGRKPCKLVRVTLEKVCAWIDAKKLDKAVTEELKKSAGTYPENALETWLKNFGTHVSRARRLLAKRGKPAQTSPGLEDIKPKPSPEADEGLGAAPTNPEFD